MSSFVVKELHCWIYIVEKFILLCEMTFIQLAL